MGKEPILRILIITISLRYVFVALNFGPHPTVLRASPDSTQITPLQDLGTPAGHCLILYSLSPALDTILMRLQM